MSLKKKATLSLVWTFTQQFGNQLIGFIVSLVLARLLLPEEFGLIGMIIIVIAIGNVLLDGGLTKSLIRGPDCDQIDYSTGFFLHLVASLVLYAIIFFSAPLIAQFYEQPVLTSITRVYSLTIIIT